MAVAAELLRPDVVADEPDDVGHVGREEGVAKAIINTTAAGGRCGMVQFLYSGWDCG